MSKCGLCEREHPASHPTGFSNKHLLGVDLCICIYCFTAWYDEGLTEGEEIVKSSLNKRGEVTPGTHYGAPQE